jgi:hypothetical protein
MKPCYVWKPSGATTAGTSSSPIPPSILLEIEMRAVTIAAELAPVSATGDGTISGQTVTFPAVPRLAPKEAVSYKIVAKGVKAGDGRTRFELTSDMLTAPVTAEESTHVY